MGQFWSSSTEHPADSGQRAPRRVWKQLRRNDATDLDLTLPKTWTLKNLPGSSYSSLWLSSAVLPRFVLCIADLTHIQIGPDGGTQRKRRKGGGKERQRQRQKEQVFSLSPFLFWFFWKATFLFYNKSAYFYSGMIGTRNKKLNVLHNWRRLQKIIYTCSNVSGHQRERRIICKKKKKVTGLRLLTVLSRVHVLCAFPSGRGTLWMVVFRICGCTVKFKGRQTGVVFGKVKAITWKLFWSLYQSTTAGQTW